MLKTWRPRRQTKKCLLRASICSFLRTFWFRARTDAKCADGFCGQAGWKLCRRLNVSDGSLCRVSNRNGYAKKRSSRPAVHGMCRYVWFLA